MKRLEEFASHLRVLEKAENEDLDNEFIISGIIDKYNIQFELGWKVMKELLREEGRHEAMTGSPRTIIKTAYQVWDFIEENVWLDMLKDRNNLSHIYDGNAAKSLVQVIINVYIPAFKRFEKAIFSTLGGVAQ